LKRHQDLFGIDPKRARVNGAGFRHKDHVYAKTWRVKRSDKDATTLTAHAPLPTDPQRVVDILAAAVVPERMRRIQEVAAQRSYRVVTVLDDIVDPHNASAILRSCDAFGVQRVHIIDWGRPFLVSKRVARGTQNWLTLQSHCEPESCAKVLKAEGYKIFVASMHGEMTPDVLSSEPKVAVVFGNEHRGPSAQMLAEADGTFQIPMRGFVESLNVSVAAAVTLYALTMHQQARLLPSEHLELVAQMLWVTVPDSAEIIQKHLNS